MSGLLGFSLCASGSSSNYPQKNPSQASMPKAKHTKTNTKRHRSANSTTDPIPQSLPTPFYPMTPGYTHEHNAPSSFHASYYPPSSYRPPVPEVFSPSDNLSEDEFSTTPSSSNESKSSKDKVRRSTRVNKGSSLGQTLSFTHPDSILKLSPPYTLPFAYSDNINIQKAFKEIDSKTTLKEQNEIDQFTRSVSRVIGKRNLNKYRKSLETTGTPDGLVVVKINDLIGFGVFATKTFKQGDFIGFYSGELRVGGINRKNCTTFDNNDYALDLAITKSFTHKELTTWMGKEHPEITPKKVVVQVNAETRGNFTRYINHTPGIYSNCIPSRCRVEGVLQSIFLVTKTIQPGEQLLWDYGIEYWKHRDIVPVTVTPATYIFNVEQYLIQNPQAETSTRLTRSKRDRPH
jgi:hypothetical protein